MLSLRSQLFRILSSNLTGRLAPDDIQELRKLSGKGNELRLAPPGVQVQPVDAGGVPAEWLIPSGCPETPVLLYFHGGAWTLGYYTAHRWMIACLAKECQARTLSVDYRLAPEHPFPAALEDCLAAYRFLLTQGIPPEQIIMGGDSAGGNLTLSAMLSLREAGEPLPAAGILLSPATDLSGPSDNLITKPDPLLPQKIATLSVAAYLAGQDPTNPLISPIYADLHGLPPLLLQIGGEEMLRPSAERFAARARAHGVNITFQVWPGMWHVWQIYTPFMPESAWAIEVAAAFFKAKMAGATLKSAL